MSRKIVIFAFIQKITTIDQFFMPNLGKIVKFPKDSSQSNRRQSFSAGKVWRGCKINNVPGVQIVRTVQRDMWAAKKKQQPEGGVLSIPTVQPIRVRDILL